MKTEKKSVKNPNNQKKLVTKADVLLFCIKPS